MFEDSDVSLINTQVYYMRMNQRPRFHEESTSDIDLVELSHPIDPKYYLELYQGVGLGYNWLDRLVIPEKALDKIINRESTHVYLIFNDDDPCGFLEIEIKIDHAEIMYFGLFPEYIGKGIGGPCLRKSVSTAWDFNPDWIEVNTCDLDSDRAFSLYTKIGFEVYNTRTEKRKVIC